METHQHEEIKRKIIEEFEHYRKRPSANFDEKHFMDYLPHPPYPKNSLKNTFRGSAMYFRFMDRIELAFGICFPMKDLDRYYSVESLAKKVSQRLSKPTGNKKVLQFRDKKKGRFAFEIVLVILGGALYYWIGLRWIVILAFAFIVFLLQWTIRVKVYERKHIKAMKVKLDIK